MPVMDLHSDIGAVCIPVTSLSVAVEGLLFCLSLWDFVKLFFQAFVKYTSP
jgi:hypothetical protein